MALNSQVVWLESVDVGVTKVAGRALLIDDSVDDMIDSVEVSHLAMARGSLSSVIAGAASLAVAEVVPSADFAGVASPADLDGMALPAVAGVVSPADLAGMAFPAVAGVASPADFAGMAIPALAGPAPLAIVEVASSSDLMEAVCSPSGCSSRDTYGGLVPDDCVTISDVVVLPDSSVLGDQTVAVLPATEAEMSGVEECCDSPSLETETWLSPREQPGGD